MVDVQYEDQVERFFSDRVDFVGFAWNREHHSQQVARVAQGIVGIDLRFADRVLVTGCRDRRHFRYQPMSSDFAVRLVADIR